MNIFVFNPLTSYLLLHHICGDRVLSNKVQQKQPIRLILFTSETCKFCPEIDRIVRKFVGSGIGSKVSVTTVDVDLSPDMALQFGVSRLPTVLMGSGNIFDRVLEGYMAEEDIRDRLMNKIFQSVLASDTTMTRRKENLIWLTRNVVESTMQKHLIRPNIGDYVHIQALQINNMSLLALDRVASALLYESGRMYGLFGPGQMFVLHLNPAIMKQVRIIPKFQEVIKTFVNFYTQHDQFPLYVAESAELIEINNMRAIIRVFGSAYAVGVPKIGETLCAVLSGELAGLTQALMGKFAKVTELSCWGVGTKYCDFLIEIIDDEVSVLTTISSDQGKEEVQKRRNLFLTTIAEMALNLQDSLMFKKQLRSIGDFIHITVIQQAFTALKIIDNYCGMLLYSAGVNFGLTADKRVIHNVVNDKNFNTPLQLKSAVEVIVDELKHPTSLLNRQHSFVYVKFDPEDENIAYIDIWELAYSAGATNVNETFCDFMAGYINGRLQLLVNEETIVREINCFGKGDSYCTFKVEIL